jgi:hypothetical protein
MESDFGLKDEVNERYGRHQNPVFKRRVNAINQISHPRGCRFRDTFAGTARYDLFCWYRPDIAFAVVRRFGTESAEPH